MILRSFGIILAMMLRVSAGDVGLIAMGGILGWMVFMVRTHRHYIRLKRLLILTPKGMMLLNRFSFRVDALLSRAQKRVVGILCFCVLE